MQKLKKWILCIFTFLISLTMFGCAKVNFETRLTSGGAITTKVDIKLDGFSTAQNAHIYDILNCYIDQLDKAYRTRLIELYSNVYDFEELEITTEKDKYLYILGQYPSRYLIQDTDDINQSGEKNSVITINKNFASIYAYVLYSYPSAFDYDEEKKAVVIVDSYQSMVDVPFGGTFTEDESLFVTKYIQSCHPLYRDGNPPVFLEDVKIPNINDIKAGDTLTQVLSDATGYTEEEVDMVFNFSTPYRRMHSNGEISQTENGYTHTWKLNGVDSKITFWRTYANSPAWYITAVAAGLLVLVVGCIVVVIIKIKRKRQGMKALKQLDALARKQESNNKK